METLRILEKKIEALVGFVHELKTSNVQLIEKNIALTGKLEKLESSLFMENESMEKLSQEKKLTKIVVDDLIKSIDNMLMENKQPL